ncbi:ftsW-like FtsW domain protein [Mycobacterium ulcerans str. Harvey]|uniref:FtsW-like FtsW domain protein n=1 Tax=Mycobacterium ulcerans str. Harvey TaxID=1299332 RepID=A0ABN0QTE9_MYCUL|nr:ftsW-like FtsW domain protein [Mycobacterium ulcerans str. Harvey]
MASALTWLLRRGKTDTENADLQTDTDPEVADSADSAAEQPVAADASDKAAKGQTNSEERVCAPVSVPGWVGL